MTKTVVMILQALAVAVFASVPAPCDAKDDANVFIESSIFRLGCEDFRDRFFERAQIFLIKSRQTPDMKALEPLIIQGLEVKYKKYFEMKGIEQEEIAGIGKALKDFYRLLFVEVPEKTRSEEIRSRDFRSLKRTLGALKVGDHSTPAAIELQKRVDVQLQAVQKSLATLGLVCESVKLEPTPSFELSSMQAQAVSSAIPLAVFGLRRALATAYQSCDSLRLSPMTRISGPNQGVEDIGSYPGGGGRMRKITDPAALARSHYYVKNFVASPLAPGSISGENSSQQCIDVRKQTMIYDFGGKPFATSDTNSTLNYWKNNADGSEGLGIDCSGYVFSALASAGLRLIKGKQLKAFEVEDYPARMYIDAASNGFTCLENAAMGKTQTLLPGDIAASKTHIVMIESIGKDPFAIQKYADCNQINYTDFDFVIAQSSPEQNAVGINKYDAKEYLAQKDSNPMQSGFVKYAREACEANKRGVDRAQGSGSFGIVRHKSIPDCVQKEIQLEGSTCIDSCKELFDQ